MAYRKADDRETRRANASWWNENAESYQRQHAPELGETSFVWSPEGVREDDLGLLGDVAGLDVLEVGCGGGQCSRWLAGHGARPVGIDLSLGQLRYASGVPVVNADAARLPFRDGSFDLACSAYGAVPFVADSAVVMREVARVLRPGGRWVFSASHPFRWCFLDDRDAITVVRSYFDRTPYVEEDGRGRATYVEHHRTFGDRVRELAAAGFVLLDVVEPEWRPGHETTFTQFGGRKAELLPGTAIFVTATRSGGGGSPSPSTRP